MMTKFLTILTSAATLAMAAIPLTAVSSVAHAAEARIQVGDLDLSRPADARVFERRVNLAASDLCNETGMELSRTNACRRAVRQEAIEKLGEAQRQSLQTANLPALKVASGD
jgi:UrcA family protein